jgi:predicted outer membrane repeat protein
VDIGAYESGPATLTVSDVHDNGPGTLRDLVSASIAGDTLSLAVTGAIVLTNGEVAIGKNLAISGPGATNLTISGNNASRVFHIADGSVNISDLRISGGNSALAGGGIYNEAGLVLSDCIIAGNQSVEGGGIDNEGWLTVVGSTVCSNTATYGGGGIVNYGGLQLTNSTICNNSAGIGGDVFSDYSAAYLMNCTIANNTATSSGGGIYSSAMAFMGNTIVAGNTAASGPDAWGGFASLGHNLIAATNGSTGWLASDLKASINSPLNPQLDALQFNGGPTPTTALLAGSPAADAGDDAVLASVPFDQRGQARPVAAHVDIGAYEGQLPRPTLSVGRSGANVILSWPTNVTGYGLQVNTNLNPVT